MFYLVFLGLNCKLWNLVFRPIYGPCAKRTGHKTRSVKKKNCRFNLLQHWKAHSFKLQSVRIWQSLPLISEQPTVDLLFHSSMMGEMDETGWLNKALKQAKPQHACYSNQMCHLTYLVMKRWKSTAIFKMKEKRKIISFSNILKWLFKMRR